MIKNIFVLILAIQFSLQAQNEIIKSLKTFVTGKEASFPVLVFNENNSPTITIEFDIQADTEPNLNIKFYFCDKFWQPYENVFLANEGYNTAYNLWFERLPSTTGGAEFHYYGTFTNYDVTFPYSGKWCYYVTDSFNPEQVYAYGRFFVVYPEQDIDVQIYNEKLQGTISTPNTLDRVYNLTVDFNLKSELVPSRVQDVEIVENHKSDYPIVIERKSFGDLRSYEWNGSSQFKFTARDIKPGNEYREVDLRDHNRFTPPKVDAQYDGIETSRFFRYGGRDLNGGSILTNYKDPYAEYMYVVFQIRPPETITDDIFLTGAFNDWQVLPEFQMHNDDGLYKITLELKRGVYDYQYVTGAKYDGVIEGINWWILEGNYWETRNAYHVFLYYSEELLGGYDKIIGYKQIYSGDL